MEKDIRKQFIKNLWLWKCGMPEIENEKKEKLNLNDLVKSEWCNEFEQLMRNRLLMGAFRYGKIKHDNLGSKSKYDRIGSIKKRLSLYEKIGNDEILVDVANLAMMEFIEGCHPQKHFASIDDGIHTEVKK